MPQSNAIFYFGFTCTEQMLQYWKDIQITDIVHFPAHGHTWYVTFGYEVDEDSELDDFVVADDYNVYAKVRLQDEDYIWLHVGEDIHELLTSLVATLEQKLSEIED